MRDIDEILPALALPVRGKTYTVRPIGARTGMRLMTVYTDKPDPEIVATKGEAFLRLILGPCYDEMVEDDVPFAVIERGMLAALADYRWGRAEAERTWEAGLLPEVRAALMAAAKTAIETATMSSTSTASESKTPSPGSTRSTTSRKRSPATPAKASNGPRSSTSGRS